MQSRRGRLRLSRPSDPEEREADRLADAVLRTPGPVPSPMRHGHPGALQRKCRSCEQEDEPLRRAADGAGSAVGGSATAGTFQPAAGAGAPLPAPVRRWYEPRFGMDFGHVRIHSGAEADASARSVHALAYTRGADIVFAAGRYDPGSAPGRRLLAHELAHVAQNGARDDARIRRQPDDEYGAPSAADDAAAQCDIPRLCGLQRSEGLGTEYIHAAARRCRPNTFVWPDPCLQPEFIVPALTTASPAKAPPQIPAAPPDSGLPDLSKITTLQFQIGPSSWTATLPSSLQGRLPVEIRNKRWLEFNFSAETSGHFTFTATFDRFQAIRITAGSRLEVGEQSQVRTGLSVTTRRRVCHAQNALEARRALMEAGTGLRDAIQNLQEAGSPPGAPAEAPRSADLQEPVRDPAAEPSPPEEAPVEVFELKPLVPPPQTGEPTTELNERLINVAGGVAKVYTAIEDAKKACQLVPFVTLGVDYVKPVDLSEPEMPAGAPRDERVEAGLIIHF